MDDEDKRVFAKDLDSLYRQIQKLDSRVRYDTNLLEWCKARLEAMQIALKKVS